MSNYLNLLKDHFTMMEPQSIIDKLTQKLPGAEISVQDLTGTKDHFRVTIVAAQFEGLLMVKQHRMIYDLLRDCMEDQGGGIHALSLNTYTPTQWQEQKQQVRKGA